MPSRVLERRCRLELTCRMPPNGGL